MFVYERSLQTKYRPVLVNRPWQDFGYMRLKNMEKLDWVMEGKNLLNVNSIIMALVKVIEVIASSENSFDDAVRNAVKEVSATIDHVDSIYVKDFKVHVKDGEIASYGAICKVAFRVDRGPGSI